MDEEEEDSLNLDEEEEDRMVSEHSAGKSASRIEEEEEQDEGEEDDEEDDGEDDEDEEEDDEDGDGDGDGDGDEDGDGDGDGDEDENEEEDEEEAEEEDDDEEEEDDDEEDKEPAEEKKEIVKKPVVVQKSQRGRKKKIDAGSDKKQFDDHAQSGDNKGSKQTKKNSKKNQSQNDEEEDDEDDRNEDDTQHNNTLSGQNNEEEEQSDESREQDDEEDEEEDQEEVDQEEQDADEDDDQDEDEDAEGKEDEEPEEEKEEDDGEEDDDDDDEGQSATSFKTKEDNELDEDFVEDDEDYDYVHLQVDPEAFQVINQLANGTKIYRLTDFYRFSSKKVKKLIDKELRAQINTRLKVQQDNRENIQKSIMLQNQLLSEWKSSWQNTVPIDNVPEGTAQIPTKKEKAKQFLPGNIKKHDITDKQLESAVVEDPKASKSDYFLHFANVKQNFALTPNLLDKVYNPISSIEYFQGIRKEMMQKIIKDESRFIPEEEEDEEDGRENHSMQNQSYSNVHHHHHIHHSKHPEHYLYLQEQLRITGKAVESVSNLRKREEEKKSMNDLSEERIKKETDEGQEKSKQPKKKEKRKKDSMDSSDMSFGENEESSSEEESMSENGNIDKDLKTENKEEDNDDSFDIDSPEKSFDNSDDSQQHAHKNAHKQGGKVNGNQNKNQLNHKGHHKQQDDNNNNGNYNTSSGKFGSDNKNAENKRSQISEEKGSIILNAMSAEEKEISRERNNHADLHCVDFAKIKERKYKEKHMDLHDSEFLEGFFKFDPASKRISSSGVSQVVGFKFPDILSETSYKDKLFGEPIDINKNIHYKQGAHLFSLSQDDKEFIHIDEPKPGNLINIHISTPGNSNAASVLDKKKPIKGQPPLLSQFSKKPDESQIKKGIPSGNNNQTSFDAHNPGGHAVNGGNFLLKQDRASKEPYQVKRLMVQKQFDYYNSEILNCSWNEPKEKFNNILIDLNDPQFFLQKVNTFFSAQRKERKDTFSKYEQIQKRLHIEDHNVADVSTTMNMLREDLAVHNEDVPVQSQQNPIQSASQQQYPVSLKTFIEQKKRDKNEQPSKYDHSSVAKMFEFNYLTQDENVFKDYHLWDIGQRIMQAQHLYEKQLVEYQNNANPTISAITSNSNSNIPPNNTNTISNNNSNPMTNSQKISSGLISMPMPALNPQKASIIIHLPMGPQAKNNNNNNNNNNNTKISMKLPLPPSQTPPVQSSTLITLSSQPLLGKTFSNSNNNNSQQQSQQQSSQLIALPTVQKESKFMEQSPLLSNIPPRMMSNQLVNPTPRQPPTKNLLLSEWKVACRGMQISDYCLKTLNSDIKSLEIAEEKVESFKHFKNRRHLSSKKDVVILMEHAEEDPLVLQNIGMNSKLFRYTYHQRVFKKMEQDQKNNNQADKLNLNQQTPESFQTIAQLQNILHTSESGGVLAEFEKELLKFKGQIQEELGELGKIIFYDEGEKTSLFGQLDDQEEGDESIGVAVIENNLFKAPIFRQKLPETDFLLVRLQENDKCQFFLRPIEYVYTVGQIEPVKSIYRPRSRDITPYMKNCLNTFIMIKIQKEKKVHFQDLLNNFNKNLTETQIRQQIKLKNLKPELNNKNVFVPKDNAQDSDNENAHDPELTPEQACMFEKMLSHVHHLSNEIGLKELRTTEKLKNVLAKFQKDRPEDIKNYTIAKLLTDQLSLTPWSLSSNFALEKSKLYLEGIGDPTNGHGGYSFIKRPLKKRSEKDEKKEDERQKEDLRKLSNDKIERLMRKLDIFIDPATKEAKKQRWVNIDLIKKKLDETDVQERPDLRELLPFKRKDRKTVKEAEQHYQKKINQLFQKLIKNLSSQELPEISQEEMEEDQECLPLEYYIEEERKIREKKKKQLKFQNFNPAHDERESTMLEENSKQFPADGSSEEDDEEEDEEENEDDENNSEAMH